MERNCSCSMRYWPRCPPAKGEWHKTIMSRVGAVCSNFSPPPTRSWTCTGLVEKAYCRQSPSQENGLHSVSACVLGSGSSVPDGEGGSKDEFNDREIELHYNWLEFLQLMQEVYPLLYYYDEEAAVPTLGPWRWLAPRKWKDFTVSSGYSHRMMVASRTIFAIYKKFIMYCSIYCNICTVYMFCLFIILPYIFYNITLTILTVNFKYYQFVKPERMRILSTHFKLPTNQNTKKWYKENIDMEKYIFLL